MAVGTQFSGEGLYVHPGAQALIFDLDGTIADTMPLHYQAWSETVREYGHEYPAEVFWSLAGMPCEMIVPEVNRRFGWKLPPRDVAAKKEQRFRVLMPQIRPLEPVMKIVREYQGRLKMAVGTGGRRRVVEQTLRHLGLHETFDAVIAAEDVQKHKPEPETFLKCAELLQVPPWTCQVFEDGDLGLIAARRAGMIATDVRPFLKGLPG